MLQTVTGSGWAGVCIESSYYGGDYLLGIFMDAHTRCSDSYFRGLLLCFSNVLFLKDYRPYSLKQIFEESAT